MNTSHTVSSSSSIINCCVSGLVESEIKYIIKSKNLAKLAFTAARAVACDRNSRKHQQKLISRTEISSREKTGQRWYKRIVKMLNASRRAVEMDYKKTRFSVFTLPPHPPRPVAALHQGWKIHRPGSALPSPAYCFASVIGWTANKNVTIPDRFICLILTAKRRWRPVFWGRQLKKTGRQHIWGKKCIGVTWLEDFLTSKWPGSFTALAPPLPLATTVRHTDQRM